MKFKLVRVDCVDMNTQLMLPRDIANAAIHTYLQLSHYGFLNNRTTKLDHAYLVKLMWIGDDSYIWVLAEVCNTPSGILLQKLVDTGTDLTGVIHTKDTLTSLGKIVSLVIDYTTVVAPITKPQTGIKIIL